MNEIIPPNIASIKQYVPYNKRTTVTIIPTITAMTTEEIFLDCYLSLAVLSI